MDQGDRNSSPLEPHAGHVTPFSVQQGMGRWEGRASSISQYFFPASPGGHGRASSWEWVLAPLLSRTWGTWGQSVLPAHGSYRLSPRALDWPLLSKHFPRSQCGRRPGIRCPRSRHRMCQR